VPSLTIARVKQIIHWLIDWLIDWLTGWLTKWLTHSQSFSNILASSANPNHDPVWARSGDHIIMTYTSHSYTIIIIIIIIFWLQTSHNQIVTRPDCLFNNFILSSLRTFYTVALTSVYTYVWEYYGRYASYAFPNECMNIYVWFSYWWCYKGR